MTPITNTNLIWLAVAVATAVVALAVLKALVSASRPKFQAKPLMTANELEFLVRLESAVPEFRFLAQVAMGALLEPAVPRSDQKSYYRLRGMFSQKIVDFVAQDRYDGSVVAIIELDDRTHDREKDAQRDAMLASAGYRIVRWDARSKPKAAAIRAELAPFLPVRQHR
jgi:Protein of unknown function (DUF2726)